MHGQVALEVPPLDDALYEAKTLGLSEIASLVALEAALDGLAPAFDPLAEHWPAWFGAVTAVRPGVDALLGDVGVLEVRVQLIGHARNNM